MLHSFSWLCRHLYTFFSMRGTLAYLFGHNFGIVDVSHLPTHHELCEAVHGGLRQPVSSVQSGDASRWYCAPFLDYYRDHSAASSASLKYNTLVVWIFTFPAPTFPGSNVLGQKAFAIQE